MHTSIYPWQEQDWNKLHQLRTRLPHAILFHGSEGIGKTDFCEHYAQSLLCEKPGESGHACAECSSCLWFSQYSHPDFRRIRPEILDDASSETEEAVEGKEEKKSSKSSKNPSKEIKIDQIRTLFDFVNISTHRQGLRVILLYPAEALNLMASNALLKTLEEPPPQTVFLLVTNRLDRMLPTILSRCRKFALSVPNREQSLDWLNAQKIDEPEKWLAEQGGAPLLAFQKADAGEREDVESLLKQLAAPTLDGMIKAAEQLQKMPLPEFMAYLQRWMYDLFSYKSAERVRYYPAYQKQLALLASRANMTQLVQIIKLLNERRAVSEHPLSPRLFIEDILLAYLALYS